MNARIDWLKQRRRGIGASEAAALFNAHPYVSAFSLWASKVADPEPDAVDDDAEDRRADGLLMEPRIAAKYARKTGRRVFDSPGLVAHPQYPYMLATPDRLVDIRGGKEPLELKWLDHFRGDDEIPVYIQIQQQQQMACLGVDMGSIAILGSFRSFHWSDIEANPPFIELLIAKIDEFWNRHVLPGIPPTADGSHATAAALRRLYPHESGETVQLDPEAMIWAERLTSSRIQAKASEEGKADAENKLKAAIGEATYGQLPDGRLLSLKTQTRGAHHVKESTFRVLRFVKGNGHHD